MKLWGGRFEKNTDRTVDDFNSSLPVDSRMYRQDINGSLTHAKTLRKCGVLTDEEYAHIKQGLKQILKDFDGGAIKIDPEAEDIHMFVESLLIEKTGEAGKKLHTGRSRNDQVALDIRMYLKDEMVRIRSMMYSLCKVLIGIAEPNLTTIMPGYTHLQRAQPVTLAHHMMAYFQMLTRDIDRLNDCLRRTDAMPLGSGALAGSAYPLDRKMAAIELGFASITQNSMDAVGDRDFALELSSCLSIHMMHLSRFCEELIIWSSQEFGFVEMDDAFSTGSSIMPQKKNPDVAELVRGKTGRVYGNMIALFTMMKSLPLAYNKDMQEDKDAIFDSVDTVEACLPVFTKMLLAMKINKEAMRKAVTAGFLNATDFADYLAKKGIPFRSAHEITGRLVKYCIDNSTSIEALSLETLKTFSDVIEDDIYVEISPEKCVAARGIYGGTAPGSVAETIAAAVRFLNNQI